MRDEERQARRPIRRWFWLVIVVAVAGIGPTSWAQWHFGQPTNDYGMCADEPWHIDPEGMRTWWLWWGLLALLVTAGGFLYHKHLGTLSGDRSAKRMLRAGIAILLLVPPIGWALSYALVGMNCGL